MPWRWGPPNGRHSCLGLICYTSLRWGRRSFVASFIDTTSPLLLYPRRSSLLNRPAFLYDRRDDFFLPWLGHSIFELAITARCVSPCPRRSHLSVRMSCGFLEVSYETACYVLAYPSRRASSVSSLSAHAAHDVIAHRLASSSRPTAPHRPSPRHPTRWAGRSACSVLWCLSCPHAVI